MVCLHGGTYVLPRLVGVPAIACRTAGTILIQGLGKARRRDAKWEGKIA